MRNKLQIKLIGPWTDFEQDDVFFLQDLPLERADGVLCFDIPEDWLQQFNKPVAWYMDEPITHRMFRAKKSRAALKKLQDVGFYHHSQLSEKLFVPMVTHFGPLTVADQPARKKEIVATVNNYGGKYWWTKKGERYRNRFILNPAVNLYGSAQWWNNFRRYPWSARRPPPNYRGEAGTKYNFVEQVQFLSQFNVALCMENASTDYYFSEKFVNAARAGCVPIYHAHPTVKSRFLAGASWIDPAEYAHDPKKTLEAALASDAERIRAANFAWLASQPLAKTSSLEIRTSLAQRLILRILEKQP